jgi:hypothetical protein
VWFLHRALCPFDLQTANFVKFIEDDPVLIRRAEVAYEQFSQIYWDNFYDWHAENEETRRASAIWSSTVEFIRDELPFEFVPDHHGQGIEGFTSGSGASVANVLCDLGIATSLDLNFDVIFNGRASSLAYALQAPRVQSTHQRLKLAEHVTAIRTIDHLGPQGAFHESLNDLRSHPRVAEFRQFMTQLEIPDGDFKKLATEVEQAADRHSRDVLDRYLKGRGKIRTIGAAAISAGANFLLPGSGGVLSGALAATDWWKARQHRKQIAWAPFVLDARDPR